MRVTIILIFLSLHISACAQINAEENNDGVLISENNVPVLFYQKAPKDHDGHYERTNYIHPLWNVDGTVLTEDFPSDHLHQRGVFWAWHQIWVDGQRVGDGWALEDYEQKVLRTTWKEHQDGSGTLSSVVSWQSDLYTENGAPVPYIEELTSMTIHPKQDNYRKINFSITLNALNRPVAVGGSKDEKGYSGFSVRMKLPEDVHFAGPDGMIDPQVTAVQSPGFVNVPATFDGDHPGGILMIDHPGNPGYPQPWILRAKNSMQNAVYPGREPVKITPDAPLTLRYSLVTYQGTLSQDQIKNILQTM